ncbi:MAG: hydroxymethylbilane synthase, partial [Propionibacteriaceae bacterium]|nr:hydroxymethylbilane synthase [Propionibacteriaceae bacterium]
RFAAEAERAVLAALGAGCAAPVGVRTLVQGDQVRLDALVASLDGAQSVTATGTAGLDSAPEALGRLVARRLIEEGAAEVVDLASSAPSKLSNLHD